MKGKRIATEVGGPTTEGRQGEGKRGEAALYSVLYERFSAEKVGRNRTITSAPFTGRPGAGEKEQPDPSGGGHTRRRLVRPRKERGRSKKNQAARKKSALT